MNKKILIAAAGATILVAGAVYLFTADSGRNDVEPSSLVINFGNNSWDALKTIELSPAAAGDFIALPLTETGLGAGGFLEYGIINGQQICTYDMRFTKFDGSMAARNGVDLCAATYYHFEDE